MDQDEDIQVEGTMTDYLIQKFMDEEQGKEFAAEYLKSSFLTSAVNALFYMRRQAGMTQAQVAERLNTTQSAVARLEGNFDGGISLHRYVDFALACGMVPHNITFVRLESAISYTLAQPKTLFTEVNYQEWLHGNFQPPSAFVATLAQQTNDPGVVSKALQKQQQEAVFALDKNPGNGSGTVAAPATTLSNEVFTQEYYQPYLIPPLQLLQGGGAATTAANQTNIKVSA